MKDTTSSHLHRDVEMRGCVLLLILLGAANALQWWQDGVIYQIYPRSFQDSDGDGIGDLKGILSRIDYIASLNVSAVWLSPIYKSPMADFGYDISDFRAIDPIFGTMDDFNELLAAFKERGIGIMMDLVPNHSSDEHEWFIKSVAREDPYTDYYMWVDGPTPPNNWLSVWNGPAWTWNEQRQQFYLHQFGLKQPDFNYRNPAIIQEIKDILTFWLDLGVVGFRFDAVTHMFEDELMRDEPQSGQEVPPDNYNYLSHIYTQNLPETPYTLSQFRAHLDDYEATAGDGLHRTMMLEIWNPIEETMAYYGNVSDFPFNFRFLTTMNANSNGRDAENAILGWVNNMPSGSWANWVLGNHDISRVNTRLQLSDGGLITTMLLPGTAISYNGEEIGMIDTYIPPEEVIDPAGYRDPYRCPFQWDTSTFAGFTTGEKPWLRINENYIDVNVLLQEEADESILKNYRKLVSLRYEPAIQVGELHTSVVGFEYVLAYARVSWEAGQLSYLIVFNWSHTETLTIDLSPGAFGAFPFEITDTTVVIRTVGSDIPMDNFDISSFELKPRAGCVVSFTPVAIP